jgi:DNA polymerase-1
VLRPRIKEQIEDVYTRIDLPLVPVLATMQRTGIELDVAVLEEMSERMSGELEDLTARIYELAGEEFNIGSPKQLGVVLFEKLNLPPPRKLKKSGQYSTAVEVLENLAETYELPRLVLDHRQRAKFKSTYVDALPRLIDDKSRLHSSFAQTVAATGRLSSHDPNLQNIPIRTPLGRDIRAAFVAKPGTTLLSADYSQVELRILAHISEDAGMVEAFISGADIHQSTAAEVLGIDPEDVTSDQRSRAKAVNFGIVYGQTPFGLARSLGISREEAEDFINRYFDRYPRVQEYIQNALAQQAYLAYQQACKQHPEHRAKKTRSSWGDGPAWTRGGASWFDRPKVNA